MKKLLMNSESWFCKFYKICVYLVFLSCLLQLIIGSYDMFTIIVLILCFICISCEIIIDEEVMQNPLNEYDPTFMLQKDFVLGKRQYRILQYFAYDQTDEGRKFVCLRLDTGQQEIFQEDELKLAIASGEAKVNI